jgi:hypothetical protein
VRSRQAPTLPTAPTKYPHSTFIETEKGYFYILNDTKRYRLLSARVLESWRPHRVVQTTEAAVAHYRIVAKMKFRNGSLIWNLSDGRLYLIENGMRRWVQSPDVFDRLGIEFDDAQVVSLDEINLHEQGEDLT